MDRQEFSMKLDELKRLEENGQYRKAFKVLECLDIKRIKSTKDLFVVVEVLIENDRFDQALDTLIGISKKLKTRRVIHQITDVAIKSGKVEIAKKYMREFQKIAPKDPYNYVFEYQMAVLEDESVEKQIEILEELKQYEYMEKWAYELAKVYHRANLDENCIGECNDLILWFSEGIYVEKAKVLRQYLIDATVPEDLYSGHYHKSEDSLLKQEDEEEREEENSIESVAISVSSEKTFSSKKARPSYQSAFDFIERMETSERDREIDEIIERAERKKKEEPTDLESKWRNSEQNQSKLSEEESDVVQEESEDAEKFDTIEEEQVQETVSEQSNEEPPLIVDGDGVAQEEQFPLEEAELPKAEVWQEEQVDEKEHPMITDVELSNLLVEMQGLMAEQVDTLMIDKQVEDVVERDNLVAEEVIEDPSKQESVVEQELKQEPVQPVMAAEPNAEAVEQLVQKRRQRATTKRLNEIVREVLGKDSDAISYLGTFGKIHSTGEDIITSLELLKEKKQDQVIVVIEGEQSEAKQLLIERLIKLYHAMGFVQVGMVGFLDEEQMYNTSFEEYVEALKDCCLVISPLATTKQCMFDRIQFFNELGCFVMVNLGAFISVEESNAIKEKLSVIADVVTIHQNEFNEEELLGFANDFIESKEYTLEPDAKEYLEKVIHNLLEVKEADTFSKLLGKTANAYHCANERNKVELRNIAESGSYKDANFMSIKVNDFADENKAI